MYGITINIDRAMKVLIYLLVSICTGSSADSVSLREIPATLRSTTVPY